MIFCFLEVLAVAAVGILGLIRHPISMLQIRQAISLNIVDVGLLSILFDLVL